MKVKTLDNWQSNPVYELVSQGDIAVIKDFMPADICYDIIVEAQQLSLPNFETPHWKIDNFKSRWTQDSSVDYYRLAEPLRLPVPNIINLYVQMRDCIDNLRFLNSHAINYHAKGRYHLELLHYRNCNYFRRHKHDYDPQFVGLILHLNQFGKDYTEGGTVFYDMSSDDIHINEWASQGDLIVFPYDMYHEVTPVVGENGRWVAVLPFY